MKNSDPIFSLEDLDDAEYLFVIEVKNQELTDALKIFKSIMNTRDHAGATNLSELAQVFAEKLAQLKINYELVHAEMMLRPLIRKRTNPMEYPDFSLAGDSNDYQIMKLDDSMFRHPSVLVGMSYGYLRRGLLSPELYTKTAPGPFDSLHVSRLSDYID